MWLSLIHSTHPNQSEEQSELKLKRIYPALVSEVGWTHTTTSKLPLIHGGHFGCHFLDVGQASLSWYHRQQGCFILQSNIYYLPLKVQRNILSWWRPTGPPNRLLGYSCFSLELRPMNVVHCHWCIPGQYELKHQGFPVPPCTVLWWWWWWWWWRWWWWCRVGLLAGMAGKGSIRVSLPHTVGPVW